MTGIIPLHAKQNPLQAGAVGTRIKTLNLQDSEDSESTSYSSPVYSPSCILVALHFNTTSSLIIQRVRAPKPVTQHSPSEKVSNYMMAQPCLYHFIIACISTSLIRYSWVTTIAETHGE